MLKDFKKPKINFTIIPDIYTDITSGERSMIWDDFVILMSNSKAVARKYDAEQLLPVKWKPSEQWVKKESFLAENKDKKTFRNDKNVLNVTIAILDLDEDGSLEQAVNKFQHYDYVVHTTFSGKHRMAIRLEKPIPVEQWELTWTHLMAGITGDRSCKNLSRGYLMPTHDANNPNAKPQSFSNKGRGLTVTDIMELGIRHMDETTKVALEKISIKSSNNNKGGVARHFSKAAANFSTYRVDDLSYEGFKRRRFSLIEELIIDPIKRGAKKGSRHSFALRTIGAEVMRFKDKVDLSKTIQFIFRATQEYDKSPLSRGNTPKEIPEIISSALSSSDIDKNTLRNSKFIQRIRDDIQHGLDVSFAAEKTGLWHFTDFTQEKGEYATTPRSMMARYDIYIERYKEKMHKNSADAEDLNKLAVSLFQKHIATPVIQEELKNNSSANFSTLGRFLLHALKTLRITSSIEDRRNTYNNIVTVLAPKLAKANLEDSVIGKKIDESDIKKEFNKAYVLEMASEAGFKLFIEKKENNRSNKKKQTNSETSYRP